jgi:hypothetical protein
VLPQIPLDDPRVPALAKARQQFAHDCTHLPTWEELTDEDREAGLPDAATTWDQRSTPDSFPP